MMTFEREVVYEDAPTDDEYLDMAVRGAEIPYGRSPKSTGKYRVERVVVVEPGGRRFAFGLRCCCRTQADHVEAALRLADLSALTTTTEPGRMGFMEVK